MKKKEKVKKKLLEKDSKDKRKRKRLEIFLEFFLFGLIMGIIEDVIAIKLSTGESITWEMVGIIALIALPFAAIGELLVDRIKLLPEKSKKEDKKQKKKNR